MPTFTEFLQKSPMDYKRILLERSIKDDIISKVKVHPLIADYIQDMLSAPGTPNIGLWVANAVRDELVPRYTERLGGDAKAINTAIRDFENKDPNSAQLVQGFIDTYLNSASIREKFGMITEWLEGMHGTVNIRNNPNAGNRPKKAFTFDEASQTASEWVERMAKGELKTGDENRRIPENKSLEVSVKWPDGFYVVELDGVRADPSSYGNTEMQNMPMAEFLKKYPSANENALESKAMGHCGTDVGADLMVSLRKDGIPYVTTSFTQGHSRDSFIYRQCKGRSNNKPVARYHPYIVDTFIHYKVEGYSGVQWPDRDFHPTDLDGPLFRKLIDGDPAILTFPDVPLIAFGRGLLTFEEAKKSVRIANFTFSETGVSIQIPKNRMSELDALCPFPDFNAVKTAGGGLTSEAGEIIGAFYALTLETKENAKMKAMMDNLFKWYLGKKGFETAGRNTSLIDGMNKLFESGDKFVVGLYDGIIKVVNAHNDMMIFPRPPVANEEGVVVERDYNKVPMDVTDRIAKSKDGASMNLTMPEFIFLVEAGGGNYGISDGMGYLTQYISNTRKNADIKAHMDQQVQMTLDFVASFVRKYLDRHLSEQEDPDQMKFGFADEFTPDHTDTVDGILAGEENAQ